MFGRQNIYYVGIGNKKGSLFWCTFYYYFCRSSWLGKYEFLVFTIGCHIGMGTYTWYKWQLSTALPSFFWDDLSFFVIMQNMNTNNNSVLMTGHGNHPPKHDNHHSPLRLYMPLLVNPDSNPPTLCLGHWIPSDQILEGKKCPHCNHLPCIGFME